MLSLSTCSLGRVNVNFWKKGEIGNERWFGNLGNNNPAWKACWCPLLWGFGESWYWCLLLVWLHCQICGRFFFLWHVFVHFGVGHIVVLWKAFIVVVARRRQFVSKLITVDWCIKFITIFFCIMVVFFRRNFPFLVFNQIELWFFVDTAFFWLTCMWGIDSEKSFWLFLVSFIFQHSD